MITPTIFVFLVPNVAATPWVLETEQNFGISKAVTDSLGGLTFNANGSSLYTTGQNNDRVYQYDLDVPYNISKSDSVISSASIATIEGFATGLAWSSTGTFLYIVGSGNDKVYQFYATTSFRADQINYYGQSTSTAGSGVSETVPTGIYIKPDGTKIYICGQTLDDVYQYSLTTPWDITTMSYDSKMKTLTTANPYGVYFKSDGTSFYVAYGSGRIEEYAMTTPWDVSTSSFTKYQTLNALTQYDVAFDDTGTQIFVVGNGTMYTYSMLIEPIMNQNAGMAGGGVMSF